MKKFKIFYIMLAVAILSTATFLPFKMRTTQIVYAENFDVQHKASILIERKSGKVLTENNSTLHLPIASVTKLMTILLTLEKVKSNEISLDDNVFVSQNANGMGGSQVFLDANENYKLNELLKSVVVASANDSSVALAEHIAGSENNFVRLMNERAVELNMNNTHYANCTGLPSTDGYSCALDQAILLNAVLDYDVYREFASIWMEDFVHPSNRITQMANTNKLSRFYSGCLGGKTGSTNEAKYCLAVGAKRNDMELISVVLGVENSKERFKLSSSMLDYGFDNFQTKTLFSNADLMDKTIAIKGQDRVAHVKAEREFNYVCKRNEEVNFSLNFNLPTGLNEVKENDVVGSVDIILNGEVMDTIDLLSCDSFDKASIWDYFNEIIKR